MPKPMTNLAALLGLRCTEFVMSLKCTECGQVFDDKLSECPNCACPASECEKVVDTILSPKKEDKKVSEVERPQNSILQEGSTPVKTTVSTDNSEKPRRSKKGIIVGICILLVISAIVGGGWYLWQNKEGEFVKYESDEEPIYSAELVKCAEKGDAEAQNNLGRCYYYGYGINIDHDEAVKWYRKAADQGNAEAQTSLGICYYCGYGINQDYSEAVKWYLKAAEQENVKAWNSLGICYIEGNGVSQDYNEAVKWYRKAAEQGLAEAQNNLGTCYYWGNGVPQNYDEAVKWIRKAAEQGLAKAQGNLGSSYLLGEGVSQDYSKAVKWYLKAAEQGDTNAQRNLGWCYYYGYGVSQDYNEATKWWRKAAEPRNEVSIPVLRDTGNEH